MRYLACVLVWVTACGSDGATATGDSGMVTEIAGMVTTSATWSGTIHITADTTIAAGVTITVAAGTEIQVATAAVILVNGTLDIGGVKGAEVHTHAAVPDAFFSDLRVAPGGTLLATYYIQDHGGMTVVGTGKATITDSRFSFPGGDFLTMSSGTIDVSYSSFGLEPGMTDNSHCDLHFNQPLGVKLTHSNIGTAIYGLMLYGGTNSDLRYNNWFSNTYDIATSPAYPVSADVSFGWFQKAAPTNAGVTKNSLAGARLTDAGPR